MVGEGGSHMPSLKSRSRGLRVGWQQLAGCRDNLADDWADRNLLCSWIPESNVLLDGKAMVIVLGGLPGLALTVLSCSVNLPSVSSGQEDVITVFS